MPKKFKYDLSETQLDELRRTRDTHPLPYVRERAAAIIKSISGQSTRDIAAHGLLKRRDKDTVRAWIRRYLEEGLDGLRIRAGRGRKPAFSPSARDGGHGPG